MKSAGASKVSERHYVQKDDKSREMSLVESTDLSQRLIHGDVRTEVCKLAVGAFVLALVIGFIIRLVWDFDGSENVKGSFLRHSSSVNS